MRDWWSHFWFLFKVMIRQFVLGNLPESKEAYYFLKIHMTYNSKRIKWGVDTMKPDLKIEIKLLDNGNVHVMLDDLRPSYYEDWNRELTMEQFLNDLRKYIDMTK